MKLTLIITEVTMMKQTKNPSALYEQIILSDKAVFKIVEIDIKETSQKNCVPRHWHRSLEIVVPKKNNAVIWIEGKTLTIPSGDFYIVNSKEIHAFGDPFKKYDYHGYAIQIKYEFLKHCFDNIDCCFFEVKKEVYKEAFYQLLNDIIETEKSNHPFKYLKLQSLAYDLVYQLLNEHCSQRKDGFVINSDKKRTQLIEVLSYLDEHYSDVFDAQSVADHFHLSYGYLAHLFKTYLNMNMKTYVDAIRIHKAESELLSSDKSITDIALDLGFANCKSFYREFRKYHHTTPKEYRNFNHHK